MSSDVPMPVVALTRGKGTDSCRNAAAGIRKIVTMTLAWKEGFKLTTTISAPNALNFTRMQVIQLLFLKEESIVTH